MESTFALYAIMSMTLNWATLKIGIEPGTSFEDLPRRLGLPLVWSRQRRI